MALPPNTNRLKFRGFRPADRGLIRSHLNTPAITRFVGGVEGQKGLFTWLSKDQEDTYGHTFWPVEELETSKFVGICGIVTVDEEDSTVLGALELGYRIAEEAQGKGYGTEAAAASLHYAFEVEETWRVVSRCVLENVGSWKVMRAVGMKHDPRLDYVSKDGTPFIVHVMTWSEWKRGGKKLCRAIMNGKIVRESEPRRAD